MEFGGDNCRFNVARMRRRRALPATQNENKSPLSFKIGSADFTPGGFLDFTTFFRSTNVGAVLPLRSVQFLSTTNCRQARLSETRLSAQYSSLSLKVDTHLTESTSLTGYVETDFLGFQPPNAYQTPTAIACVCGCMGECASRQV